MHREEGEENIIGRKGNGGRRWNEREGLKTSSRENTSRGEFSRDNTVDWNQKKIGHGI